MKKLLFCALALLAITLNISAQQTGKVDKTKNKNKDYGYNNWMGGERINGEGPSVTETRDIKDFKGFKSGISADITLKQTSGGYKVTVEGQKNILALLTLEVVEGNLKIGFQKGYSVNYKETLRITLEAPSFSYMGMSGSGDVRAEGTLSGDKMGINISGSGNFDISELKYTNVSVGISGSGNITVAGSAESVELSISGSGDVNADNLKAQKANCRVSGSGNISLNASKELDALISGSGDIRYSGSPASLRTRVSGSGDIKSR
jgi:hypothetical protein